MNAPARGVNWDHNVAVGSGIQSTDQPRTAGVGVECGPSAASILARAIGTEKLDKPTVLFPRWLVPDGRNIPEIPYLLTL